MAIVNAFYILYFCDNNPIYVISINIFIKLLSIKQFLAIVANDGMTGRWRISRMLFWKIFNNMNKKMGHHIARILRSLLLLHIMCIEKKIIIFGRGSEAEAVIT